MFHSLQTSRYHWVTSSKHCGMKTENTADISLVNAIALECMVSQRFWCMEQVYVAV